MRALFRHLQKSTGYAWSVILFAMRHEAAFRYESLLVIVALVVACLLAQDWRDIFYLITPLVMAMALELCNTSIENIVNVISNAQIKPVFKIIKDCAAAAIFVLLCWSACTWIIYLIHRVSF